MSVIIKKIFDEDTKRETGAILTVILDHIPKENEKLNIEQTLIQYAFDTLYPQEGLNFYSNIEVDTPSIVVIRNINGIKTEEIDIALPKKHVSTFQEFIGGFKNRKL